MTYFVGPSKDGRTWKIVYPVDGGSYTYTPSSTGSRMSLPSNART